MKTLVQDTVVLDSVAGRAELALLKELKVGDTRQGVLLPALEVGMVWTLVQTVLDGWVFEGRFFGQPLYRMTIMTTPDVLALTVEGL